MDERDGIRKHTYEWVFDGFRQNKFNIEGLITHRFPFTDYKHALRLAANHKGQSNAIKVMMQA